MQLSLIICTYQRPNEIQRLLKTVMTQTISPDEVIIVDGSLDDKTEKVINKITKVGDNNLMYVHVNEAERGLTRQRNVGVKHAKGNIIAFLDDDTIPHQNYFAEILACFQRHPDAVGVGGLITNEVVWIPARLEKKTSLGVFRWEQWERREDFRWRLRKFLKLDSPLPPGWIPSFGLGRPGIYPPDGKDYQVESVMGGASAWRRQVFDKIQFSDFFHGYGLYEDLDFCVRVLKIGNVYLCTRAQLEHHHAVGGRPNDFKYGEMVARNGWFVWRRRWPYPAFIDRYRWWVIMLMLTLVRLVDFRGHGTLEALGRLWGMLQLFWSKPNKSYEIH